MQDEEEHMKTRATQQRGGSREGHSAGMTGRQDQPLTESRSQLRGVGGRDLFAVATPGAALGCRPDARNPPHGAEKPARAGGRGDRDQRDRRFARGGGARPPPKCW